MKNYILLFIFLSLLPLQAGQVTATGKVYNCKDPAGGGWCIDRANGKKMVIAYYFESDESDFFNLLRKFEETKKQATVICNLDKYDYYCGKEGMTIGSPEAMKRAKENSKVQQKWEQERRVREATEKAEKQARLQNFVGVYTNEDNPHEVSERYRFEVTAKEGSTNSLFIKGYKKEDRGNGMVKICKIDEPLEFKTNSFYYFENFAPYDVERIIAEKKTEILSDNSLTQAQKNWDIKEMEKKIRHEYFGDNLNKCRSGIDINDKNGGKEMSVNNICESFCYEVPKKQVNSGSGQKNTNRPTDELKQSINKLKSLFN